MVASVIWIVGVATYLFQVKVVKMKEITGAVVVQVAQNKKKLTGVGNLYSHTILQAGLPLLRFPFQHQNHYARTGYQRDH